MEVNHFGEVAVSMAELTLQIPDELAERLKSIEQQLPALLEQLVQDEGIVDSAVQVGRVPNSDVLVYTDVGLSANPSHPSAGLGLQGIFSSAETFKPTSSKKP